ncbi:pYEATS domain-containing protein [Aquimarina sp. 2201CG5-10]|uniref:pYEATS domain-containing protein n=1 Tax=Aquimarina callyspongiae TaxID=3098150 RepID=UPI002AB3AB88|nr:pYEATS domain-containing protein [Aquimarina sp. 2201CG5-10]MDY8135363.1 pYEATS domain-containing protein [Aquimarina sp. 2201CG5-10]
MEQKYNLIAILNTNFQPVTFRLKGKKHYQIILRIESKEFDEKLEKVTYVEYELHKSFKNRTRIAKSKHNQFEIDIKAWGSFVVQCTVGQIDGEPYTFSQNIKDVLQRKAM